MWRTFSDFGRRNVVGYIRGAGSPGSRHATILRLYLCFVNQAHRIGMTRPTEQLIACDAIYHTALLGLYLDPGVKEVCYYHAAQRRAKQYQKYLSIVEACQKRTDCLNNH